MKIVSHELEMASSYSFSQSLISAKTSFESLLPEEVQSDDAVASMEQAPRVHPLMERESNCQCENSLFSIIQRLIEALHARMNLQMSQAEDGLAALQASRSQKLSLYEKFHEEEHYAFSTKGHIQTESQEICIDIDFSLSRSFIIENKMDVAQFHDPLVINLNGEVPELSETKFSFDLDNDGTCDQVSMLKEGNGYLAWDKNEDGEINQGSELFGTRLGNGFVELAEHDLDKNDWIDENDAIFDKLRIWKHNEDGSRELCALGEVGVGAIYLNNVEGDFTYKTDKNESLGALRSSGIFLHEDGHAGAVAQIDLALKDEGEKKTPLSKLLQA